MLPRGIGVRPQLPSPQQPKDPRHTFSLCSHHRRRPACLPLATPCLPAPHHPLSVCPSPPPACLPLTWALLAGAGVGSACAQSTADPCRMAPGTGPSSDGSGERQPWSRGLRGRSDTMETWESLGEWGQHLCGRGHAGRRQRARVRACARSRAAQRVHGGCDSDDSPGTDPNESSRARTPAASSREEDARPREAGVPGQPRRRRARTER